MALLPRRFLFGVCAVALAIGLATAVHGKMAPVVVGLARCSDCTRKNMNAEAAFRVCYLLVSGLQVAVKCKNGKGEYESKAVGHVDKSGAFSVPLDAGLVGDDGELKQDCFAQLHSASSAPCPGQEPSKIVAARTFVALAGEVHQPSAECASAFLCDPLHKHHPIIFHKPVIVPPKHNHDHDHDHDHNHDHDHDHDHNHDHDLPPAVKTPTTPVYTPAAPTPSPIYHTPAQRDAVTEPQLFKKMLPFLKKLPFFPPAKQSGKP